MNAKQRVEREAQRLEDYGILQATLQANLEADPHSVPCLDRDRWPDWTSEHPADLNRAARACQTCPALQECATYADKWERRGAGVWAGKRRGSTQHGATQPGGANNEKRMK